MTGLARTTLLLAVASLVLDAPASAHAAKNDPAERAAYEQRLSESLPSGSVFRDETGRTIRLSDYYGGAPIVVVFGWYGCTTLCPTVVDNLVRALSGSGLAPDEYTVVVASIDARDSPADASRMKRIWLDHAASAEAQRWHLLTGTEPAITALAQGAGFHYDYDADSHQYAHPAGIIVVTPTGTISRYFFGFGFTPAELRAALGSAAAERVASPVERLLLLCFHFSPAGRYGDAVMAGLRWTSVGLLVAGLPLLVRLRQRPPRADEPMR